MSPCLLTPPACWRPRSSVKTCPKLIEGVMRVARTNADLVDSDDVLIARLNEAIQFPLLDRQP